LYTSFDRVPSYLKDLLKLREDVSVHVPTISFDISVRVDCLTAGKP